jgi:acetyltransferase-like isoleucine patch superfamily enzyme
LPGGCLNHLATTIETIGAHVVAQVRFTAGTLNGNARLGQKVVCATHVTLGTALAGLLYGHDSKLQKTQKITKKNNT